jgi:hypothetical protein
VPSGPLIWCYTCGVTERGLARWGHPNRSPLYARVCAKCRAENFGCPKCYLPISYRQYVQKSCEWCKRGLDAVTLSRELREFARSQGARAASAKVRPDVPFVQFETIPWRPIGRPLGNRIRRAMQFIVKSLTASGGQVPSMVLYQRAVDEAGIPAWVVKRARERLGCPVAWDARARRWVVRLPEEKLAQAPADLSAAPTPAP